MGIGNLKNIKKQLMWNFSILLLLDPIINVIILMSRISTKLLLLEILQLAFMSLLICFGTILVYHFITNKLQRMINENSRDEASIRFANKFPKTVSILFCLPVLTFHMLLSLLSYINDLIISPYQLAFYFLKDISLIASLALFHYYRFKI